MSHQTIWNALKGKGLSDYAVAAIMGNMEAESNCVACRLQGDFSTGYTTSQSYARRVDNGEISEYDFVNRGPNGGGFGLCQWTYPPRKKGLYALAKARGTSIGDEETQIEWFWKELHLGEYQSTLVALTDVNATLYSMVSTFVKKFEMPYDQSEGAIRVRLNFAQKIYEECSGGYESSTGQAEDPPETAEKPASDYVPATGDQVSNGSTESCTVQIRKVKKGDYGRDVYMLQCALNDFFIDLDFYCGRPDGDFGKNTVRGLSNFKKHFGLPDDGVADQDVWQIIFQ